MRLNAIYFVKPANARLGRLTVGSMIVRPKPFPPATSLISNGSACSLKNRSVVTFSRVGFLFVAML
mgnify:CR=1 FL=1